MLAGRWLWGRDARRTLSCERPFVPRFLRGSGALHLRGWRFRAAAVVPAALSWVGVVGFWVLAGKCLAGALWYLASFVGVASAYSAGDITTLRSAACLGERF